MSTVPAFPGTPFRASEVSTLDPVLLYSATGNKTLYISSLSATLDTGESFEHAHQTTGVFTGPTNMDCSTIQGTEVDQVSLELTSSTRTLHLTYPTPLVISTPPGGKVCLQGEAGLPPNSGVFFEVTGYTR